MGKGLSSSKSKKNSSKDLLKRKNAKSHRIRSVKKSRKSRRRIVSSESRDSSSSCSTCRKTKLKMKKKKKKMKRSLKSRNMSLSCSTSSEPIEARNKEIDRWMSEGNVEKHCFFDQFEDSLTQEFEPFEELEMNARIGSRIKSEIVVADKHDIESDDLESSLRQKALENLMKLRPGLVSDRKNESAVIESSERRCEIAEKIVFLPKFHSIVSEERDIQSGVSTYESKVNDFVQLPSMEVDYSTSDKKRIFSGFNQSVNSKQFESNISGQSTSNQLNEMGDSLVKVSHRQKKFETAKKIISLPKSHSIVSEERHIQLGVSPHESKVNDFVQLPSIEANCSTSDKNRIFSRLNQSVNDKQLESSISGQSTSNQLNEMEDSPDKVSHRQKKCETGKKIISLPKSHSIVSEERQIQLRVLPHDSKVNTVIELPSLDSTSDNKKRLFSRLNQSENNKQFESSISGQSTSNRLNDMENSPEKVSHMQKKYETAKKIISLPKSHSIVSEEKQIQLGVLPHDSKLNTVMQLPSLDSTSDNKKRLFSRLNQSVNSKQLESSISGQSTSYRLNDMEDSPEKVPKKCETAKKIISLPKSHSIVSEEKQIQLGVLPHDSKVNSVMQLPSLDSTSDKKRLFSRLNQSVNSKQLESSSSNPPNEMEDSPEKMSHKQSPCIVSQEKNVTEVCGSGDRIMSEVNLGDRKEKIREKNETLGECQSGSEFEQKTFSRMHDGEMVQVSYKVYIPKKTPALARRKLQR